MIKVAKQINEQELEGKKSSKFQAFILVFLVPLLAAITVALIVLNALGYNVFELTKEYGSKLPFVSQYLEANEIQSIDEYEKKMINLEADILDKEAIMKQLEEKLTSKDQVVRDLNEEITKLQAEIEILNEQKLEHTRALSDLVKTYETMASKKAAAILEEMAEEEALQILSKLKSDTLAEVLSKMTPATAAKFTELLSSEATKNQ